MVLASLPVPLAATGLVVRWLHVLAAAIVVGGSVLTWLALRTVPRDGREAVLAVARGYEWLFWAAVGTLVFTGVGNLGALAPTLPGGRWRSTLDLKLGVLAALLVGSALRVCLLSRLRRERRQRDSTHPDTTRHLRLAYGVTAAGLVAVLTLAEVLAHG